MTSSIWDETALHMPSALIDAYRRALDKRSWAVTDGNSAVGGASLESAREHFTSRFQVNACRQVAISMDPLSLFDQIPRELSVILSSDRIRLLDLACGAGAATLGLLCTEAVARYAGGRPCTPINVHVDGADISPDSLELFKELFDTVGEHFAAVGIEASLQTLHWDAKDPISTRNILDDFWLNATDSDRLVVVSLISGTAGQEAAYKEFQLSFEQIKMRTIDKGTLLWVEPGEFSRARWLMKRFDDFFRRLKYDKQIRGEAEYAWYDSFGCGTHPCRVAALLLPRNR